jgi:hypothetical protein
MPLPKPKPYTLVRLIEDKHQIDRFEVRVSTFVEFDDNAGRRAISGLPTRDEALQMAKEIARAKRVEEGF